MYFDQGKCVSVEAIAVLHEYVLTAHSESAPVLSARETVRKLGTEAAFRATRCADGE